MKLFNKIVKKFSLQASPIKLSLLKVINEQFAMISINEFPADANFLESVILSVVEGSFMIDARSVRRVKHSVSMVDE